jgi:hypothetical protein
MTTNDVSIVCTTAAEFFALPVFERFGALEYRVTPDNVLYLEDRFMLKGLTLGSTIRIPFARPVPVMYFRPNDIITAVDDDGVVWVRAGNARMRA